MDRGKGKSKESGESGPSTEDLKKTICNILSKVDFNTVSYAIAFNRVIYNFFCEM